MRTIVLLADDGETLLGRLAEQWGEVPLAGFARLAAAETLPERIEAAAALVGLPPGPLLDNVEHFAKIVAAAPWLFGGDELPAVDVPCAYFTHLGTTYQHQGNLDKIRAEQMEALLAFLRDNEGHHLACAPQLLAVLYCPTGQRQTAEVVSEAAAALASLPMSLAWPALASFTGSSGARALSIQTAFALRVQVENLLAQLETTAGGSSIFWRRPLRFLFRTWLANVRKLL